MLDYDEVGCGEMGEEGERTGVGCEGLEECVGRGDELVLHGLGRVGHGCVWVEVERACTLYILRPGSGRGKEERAFPRGVSLDLIVMLGSVSTETF